MALAENTKTEDRLREIEQRYQAILDNSSTIIFIKDVAGRYLQVNHWFERLFHLNQHEVLGKTDFDLFPETIARTFQENDRKVLETGSPLEIEEVAAHDGGLRTYISAKFPLRRSDGTIYAIAGISTDITTRKEAEDASRRLAAIVESSDDAIVSKDLNGVITSWNKAAERIFGYRAEEVIGRPISVLIPPDRANEEPGILNRIRHGERVDHYETIRRHKNGGLLDISLTISPVKDGTGRIVGASKIARDISHRKRSERQQRALFELVATVNRVAALPEIYAAALDAVIRCQDADRAAILLYDDQGVMRFKIWQGLSGDYRQAVEGHPPWLPDDSDPQPVCIDNVAQAPLDERLRVVVEREGIGALAFIPMTYERRLLGKFMVYYNRPHAFTPEELRPAQTIAAQVVFAIARHKSGEALERLVGERTASLREAVAQMEEFSYSVSHDLRAPVRAMQGYARAVIEDYGDRLDKQGREYVDRIVRSSSRMDRLIQDILIYSRVARGEIRLQNISLDKLVREIVQQYPLMQPPHAEVMVAIPLLEVHGHEPSLTQAISNLLSNAVKFVTTGTLPKVRVWTERRDGEVRLWIKDNGIGIRPEFQHRLFGMFERIHPDRHFEGTGIGLAIVRKAVERMGGHVGVESSGGDGSRFWIELPAARPA
jgi:PAS domain S-box-containing protein